MRRRVVVTGTGIVGPVGNDTASTWNALKEGRSGLGPIRHFDASTFPSRIAGEVRGLSFWPWWQSRGPGYTLPPSISRTTLLAVPAACEAWDAAGLDRSGLDPSRAGIYLGAGKGDGLSDLQFLASFFGAYARPDGDVDLGRLASEASGRFDPLREVEAEPGRTAVHLASILGVEGPVSTCLTACAAGAQAIGEAMRMIQDGDADVVLAGGTHAMITPQGITGFCLLGALSTYNECPTEASRPFDKTRNGFVLSEGAAMLVLESEDHARRRDAPVLGEVAGYGCTADSYRVTDPHPEGRGEAEAILRAMADARIESAEVGYINAHGTSTQDNDQTETMAIKAVFGPGAHRVPVSSTKSMTGHLIAAAGALEAIVCLLSIRDGVVPPTTNLRERDEACDLDYVPHHAREARVDVALSNSFGFGGQNTTLVLRRF